MTRTTAFKDFYLKPLDQRLKVLAKHTELTEVELEQLKQSGALPLATADRMIENVIGVVHLPLGLAVNFRINQRDYLIPMAIEEPSVVAGASYAAKLTLPKGFTADADEPIMIGQLQLIRLPDVKKAQAKVLAHKTEILEQANKQDATLIKLGGGARDLQARVLATPSGPILVVHLLVNVLDAMGANAVNTMAEAIAPMLEQLTGGKVRLRIISNLAVHRLARAKTVWKKEALAKEPFSGEEVVQGIIEAYEFADADPFRATTNNKGIMNGISSVTIATGNDWRAVEAGAHAYAAVDGRYKPLAKYSKNADGDLVGEIELPIAVGIIGGSIRTNPLAPICLKILGVKSARELAGVMAAVGLAQNFAALRALATEGIQRGHMRLHARNIAVMAGATNEQIYKIAEQMAKEKNVRLDRAKELLSQTQP